ncbi:hypothetical protein EMIT0347P_40604 [Pseudomonas sp. IT-347P]
MPGRAVVYARVHGFSALVCLRHTDVYLAINYVHTKSRPLPFWLVGNKFRVSTFCGICVLFQEVDAIQRYVKRLRR